MLLNETNPLPGMYFQGRRESLTHPEPTRFREMRKTLKHIMTEYGAVALVLYLLIFAIVLCGSWVAIRAGWAPESATGKVGTFAAAYVVTKVTQPLRIGLTVILTPFVARLWERMVGQRPQSS
jgi:hypothetical protein